MSKGLTDPVTTVKGLKLLEKVKFNIYQIEFTRFGIGTGERNININDIREIEQIRHLVDIKQSVPIGETIFIGGTAAKIRGMFTNQDLNTGYNISEIGLFAKDPDEGEILYSIILFTKQDYFPSFDGFSSSSITLTYYTSIPADHLQMFYIGAAKKEEVNLVSGNAITDNADKDYFSILDRQADLLVKWNEENIDRDIVQARLNMDLLLKMYQYID